MQTRREFIKKVGLGIAGCYVLSGLGCTGIKQKRPNILLIMVDDMGFSDIGCYGGEVQTPTLDALAKKGIRFSQFYNTARCCPTRASLLSGLHPHQAGIGHMTREYGHITDVPENPYQGWLNDRCVTIAEVLKSTGYRCYMSGKWHVGTHDKETWPLGRGFDRFYGIISGASNFFKPNPARRLTLDNKPAPEPDDDFYLTDTFTDYSLQFLEEHQKSQTEYPFFMYMAYTAPHWPLQAWEEDVQKYRNSYKIGWDKLRQQRFKKQKDMGLLDSNWSLSDRPENIPSWESIDDSKKIDELDHLMSLYAAMIDRVDQNLARIFNFLDKKGMMENTLIIFLSDNGACAEGKVLGSYERHAPGSRTGYGQPAYGDCWANASNAPFRRYKHFLHEGGISTPLIISWTEGIPESMNGSITHQYGYLPDIMTTLVDITGASYPTKLQGKNIVPMEGRSLKPLLKGKNSSIHQEPICWEHEHNAAVRLGKWKLVRLGKEEWELYDLEKDRTETKNLAGDFPEKVMELAEVWNSWAERVGYNPDF